MRDLPQIKRVYVIEDDLDLANEACTALTNAGYESSPLEVNALADRGYWAGLGLQEGDALVLDINFKAAGVRYTGTQVLQVLERASGTTGLEALAQVPILVATSLSGYVDSDRPHADIGTLNPAKVRVYGMQKDADGLTGMVNDYGANLVAAIGTIQDGTRPQLNR